MEAVYRIMLNECVFGTAQFRLEILRGRAAHDCGKVAESSEPNRTQRQHRT